MKEKQGYLTVQAFAKLLGVTKHTLYHYEAIGIFRPIYISDKGYRYYSYRQYDELRFILLLREMGVPLEEIRDCLSRTQDISALLKTHIDEITQKMAALERTKQYMVSLCDYAKACKDISIGEIESAVLPERTVYGASVRFGRKAPSYEKSLEVYAKFCYDYQVEAVWLSGARISLKSIQAGDYYRYEYTFSDHLTEADGALTPEVLPAGTWLILNYQGRYESCYQAYHALMEYAAQRGLRLAAYGYEFYITNNIITQSEEKQIIRVTIQVLDT